MSKKSQSSLLVSICDKHHSLNCILNDYGKIGKRLWRDYEIDQKDLLWYYKSLCQNFKKFLKNHKTLKDKFQRNVNELDHFCKKIANFSSFVTPTFRNIYPLNQEVDYVYHFQ